MEESHNRCFSWSEQCQMQITQHKVSKDITHASGEYPFSQFASHNDDTDKYILSAVSYKNHLCRLNKSCFVNHLQSINNLQQKSN